MIAKLRYIFSHTEKLKLIWILFLLVVGSFMELVGVSVFLPFVQIMMDQEVIYTNEWLNYFYVLFGFRTLESYLAAIALLICAVYLIKNVYLTFMQNEILKFSYHTRMNLATRLLTTYMSEPYTFHLNRNIAELQRSIQYDANQFMLLINASLQLLAELAVIICLGLYLFHTSHSITLVIMSLLIICIGIFFVISKKISRKLGKQNEMYNEKLYQWINQSLGGIKEIKVLNRERYFVSAYKNNYKKLIKGAKNNEILSAIPKYIIETDCMVGMLLAIIIKMFWGQNNIEVFIVQLSAFAVAAFRLLPSVGKINAYINNIMYCIPSLDFVYHDLKSIEGCRLIDFEEKNDWQKGQLKEKIEICDVAYHYPDTDNMVISNINFTIHKGETVALIGSSGAGKTTLADILLGLLEPVSGNILVDGVDIAENMDEWHHMLGYIPQTIYLSDDTIRNNIAFGVSEEMIDDEAVNEALRKAQLFEFVRSLPEGMDTFVGDRGVRLSGGQRQRIGIARALYNDPDVLILDEATSALDNDTEAAVMEAIENLRGHKTMIIIAHRLTTIRNADVIYEIGNGEAILKSKKEVLGDL